MNFIHTKIPNLKYNSRLTPNNCSQRTFNQLRASIKSNYSVTFSFLLREKTLQKRIDTLEFLVKLTNRIEKSFGFKPKVLNLTSDIEFKKVHVVLQQSGKQERINYITLKFLYFFYRALATYGCLNPYKKYYTSRISLLGLLRKNHWRGFRMTLTKVTKDVTLIDTLKSNNQARDLTRLLRSLK